jgi:hypothetical protein
MPKLDMLITAQLIEMVILNLLSLLITLALVAAMKLR